MKCTDTQHFAGRLHALFQLGTKVLSTRTPRAPGHHHAVYGSFCQCEARRLPFRGWPALQALLDSKGLLLPSTQFIPTLSLSRSSTTARAHQAATTPAAIAASAPPLAVLGQHAHARRPSPPSRGAAAVIGACPSGTAPSAHVFRGLLRE